MSLAIQMRAGEQISKFGAAVDHVIGQVKWQLPEDLIYARVSDQPLQASQNTDLFMTALYEAVALVVLVAFLGFWEWRSALLMMLSMPITLALTFGMIYMLGIELQQVSIATLIVALGLLVDDPVVAGDAIKRQLEEGKPRLVAAWLGPTQLAQAILFATITNTVAYLPFLLLTGTTGEFLYSLPVVMACALVASRLVSMSFIPLARLLPAAARPSGRSAASRSAGRAASRASIIESAAPRSATASWSSRARWRCWCWAGSSRPISRTPSSPTTCSICSMSTCGCATTRRSRRPTARRPR